jgi:membrane protein
MLKIATLKQLLQEFSKDKVGQLSAAFSYGAIFSLGPLLLVLISVIGFIYGAQAAQGKLVSELSGTLGASGAHTIQSVINHSHKSSRSVLALVIGVVGMLLGATGITSQLQNSFNSILGVVPDPKGGIKRTVYVKAKNVLVVLLGGLVIAASLVASTLVIGFGKKLKNDIGIPAIGLEVLNSLISLTVFVMLYLVYRTLPDLIIPKKIALKTAIWVSVLFLIGKIILSIIIGRNGTTSAYGAAASVISLLLWIYYSGEILFLGSEGIKVYGYNHSITYKPKKFNLKRTTVTLDSENFNGKLAEAWVRGFRKHHEKLK